MAGKERFWTWVTSLVLYGGELAREAGKPLWTETGTWAPERSAAFIWAFIDRCRHSSA